MGFDNVCNTGLVLGLGFSTENSTTMAAKASADNMRPKIPVIGFEPNLTLSLISGTCDQVIDEPILYKKLSGGGGGGGGGADSGGSSFSNVSVKREREVGSCEEAETTVAMDHKICSSRIVSDEDDDVGINGRKKLRLTKAQSALLEESFKLHSTLSPKQKQELARELKLRPRQVDVWFQKRRARTKLKQTEVDCEYLKKCCETLTAENRRLQKEVQDLKALKAAQPLYMQLPAATLTMCPSCERVTAGGSAATDNSSNTTTNSCPFGSNSHFHSPFTNPSAAC